MAIPTISTALPSSRFATSGPYPPEIESPTSTIFGSGGLVRAVAAKLSA